MAFNKSKALENALKFLNQGKTPQAIAEYQQILRNDPKDQATLMTVGDLYARQGDMSHAVEYFERLAQVYLSDGFNSKAIAIYKKIAKLAPNELAPLERLADLYVQQGVLSEARPLFLQIAEAQIKANHATKAVEVLHRLLDVEPENLRVQMRLAELYNVMGQKKEAAETYLAYAQRLFDRGETEDSEKLIDRALGVDPANAPAHFLKAKALSANNKPAEAIATLARHPEADAGGDVTRLLVDFELQAGHVEQAASRARRQLARGHEHFGLLYHVAESLIQSGRADETVALLAELQGPMIEAGEQDKFLKSLTSAAEALPGRTEPLEMLADFCRTTSDPFPLNAALGHLSDAYAGAGNYERAEQLLEELVERNKNDERVAERLTQFRALHGGAPEPAAVAAEQPVEAELEEQLPIEEAAIAPPVIIEEQYDEETQRYIAQALTDVDLFSSYGLTQKATHLLETVLERAPRHTPTLERLLDMYLGAGNERRTAELAAVLEQIHRERNDYQNADRFSELRQRFQRAAGITEEELPSAPPAAPVVAAQPQPEAHASPDVVVEAPPAFDIASPSPEPEPLPAPEEAKPIEFEVPLAETAPEESEEPLAAPPSEPAQPEPVVAGQEVDLSDEWDAISQEAAESPAESLAGEPESVHESAPESVAAAFPEAHPELEAIFRDAAKQAPERDAPIAEEPAAQEASAAPEESVESTLPEEPAQEETPAEVSNEPTFETVEEPAAQEAIADSNEFELELAPEPSHAAAKASAANTEDFISELVAEIDGFDAPTAEPEVVSAPARTSEATALASEPAIENLNELAEVFQEFRSELGELSDEDEDLETHYNLGIAYREMGLLDEAIGEFQKVAKAIQLGKPFRYEMNCSAMLALTFMDKGEAKIASLWYQRALETPGLDQETVLALRYDLAGTLEAAGDSTAALDSFRQVYAINIDYRDVADRIATLRKS
ncbi:MAG: tetratricopeptide repeat protein [Candidatus Acidiferrales bacterium]